jgi:hypothetical protein
VHYLRFQVLPDGLQNLSDALPGCPFPGPRGKGTHGPSNPVPGPVLSDQAQKPVERDHPGRLIERHGLIDPVGAEEVGRLQRFLKERKGPGSGYFHLSLQLPVSLNDP